jgi:long-chain acyl-CoA synthetase
MAGYYKNDTATADVLQDGWFRTGDLCRRDADGFLYVTGRAKDVIITSAGKNVYPEEVAEHYANLPRVKEMVVLGMPTADGIGETVDAVMVLDLEGVADVDRSAIEEEVRNAAAKVSDRIPSYQQIQNIHFWTDELPRTTTLKVKRSEVARMIQLRERPAPRSGVVSLDDDSAVDAPTRNRLSGNARWVNETLARMTRREADAIEPGHHLLLDLGVDSLMKLELLGEIDACFGIELTDEVSNRIGRVSDLISLIGRRERVDGKGASGRNGAWRERLKKAPSKSSGRSGGSGNGRIATPLLPLRWAFRTGVGAFFHSYIRVECHGTENLPKSGGFILAANHASHLDSGSVVTALAPALRRSRRRCYIAGAQDYFFNNPFKATIFRDCFDTIPFDRHSDGLEGLRRCGDALRRGQAVLIFPEGTRSLSGEIQQFKIGFAVLAVEVGAPIVPVRIVNAFDLMPKGRRIARPGVIEAHFGTPVMPEKIEADGFDDRYAQYRALAESVQRSVESLGEGGPG